MARVRNALVALDRESTIPYKMNSVGMYCYFEFDGDGRL